MTTHTKRENWQIVNDLERMASDLSYGRVPETPEQFENGCELALEAAAALTDADAKLATVRNALGVEAD